MEQRSKMRGTVGQRQFWATGNTGNQDFAFGIGNKVIYFRGTREQVSSPWGGPHYPLTIHIFFTMSIANFIGLPFFSGERGGSVVECRTPEREVRGSRPTAAVLCP